MKKKILAYIRRFQQGDGQAFTAIVESYRQPLFNFLWRLAGDEHEAEDLLQETFLRAMHGLNRYQHQQRLFNWLCRIAGNVAYDYLRSKKRKRLCYEATLEKHRNERDLAPMEALESSETHRLIQQALLELPLAQRQVFLLREECEFSFKEIAEILDIPINTALARMRYAVEKLRKQLQVIKDAGSV